MINVYIKTADDFLYKLGEFNLADARVLRMSVEESGFVVTIPSGSKYTFEDNEGSVKISRTEKSEVRFAYKGYEFGAMESQHDGAALHIRVEKIAGDDAE